MAVADVEEEEAAAAEVAVEAVLTAAAVDPMVAERKAKTYAAAAGANCSEALSQVDLAALEVLVASEALLVSFPQVSKVV